MTLLSSSSGLLKGLAREAHPCMLKLVSCYKPVFKAQMDTHEAS